MTEQIFHIARVDDVERLRAEGRLEPPSFGVEGFVHCSTAEQVVATTERVFDPGDELVLIELDLERVGEALRWPEVYPGQRFPHLHRPIAVGDVVAVHRWGPSQRRSWPVPG